MEAQRLSRKTLTVPVWSAVIMVISNLVDGYLLCAIMCFLFNLLSRLIGGIELEMEVTSD
ncbi:DUF3566 domain-containing protein [Vibrio cholerae]